MAAISKTITHPVYAALVAHLRRLREEFGLTQEALSKTLGRPQSFVSKVEGRERRLDAVELVQWALAIQASPTELIEQLASDLESKPPRVRRSAR